MNRIRGAVSGIVTYFEEAVSKLENHDAIIGRAIAQLDRASIQTKHHHKRVLGECARLAKLLDEYTQEEKRWRQRAKEIRETDKEKAIECLKRAHEQSRNRLQIEEQHNRYKENLKQVEADLSRLEILLTEVKQRKSELQARSSRTAALKHIPGLANSPDSFEELFSRWELQIGSEPVPVQEIDALRAEFEQKEVRAALEEELASL